MINMIVILRRDTAKSWRVMVFYWSRVDVS